LSRILPGLRSATSHLGFGGIPILISGIWQLNHKSE